MGEIDLIPLEKVAERLRISRSTMSLRVKDWHLTVYKSPANKRLRLLDWAEVERANTPQRANGTAAPPATEGM